MPDRIALSPGCRRDHRDYGSYLTSPHTSLGRPASAGPHCPLVRHRAPTQPGCPLGGHRPQDALRPSAHRKSGLNASKFYKHISSLPTSSFMCIDVS